MKIKTIHKDTSESKVLTNNIFSYYIEDTSGFMYTWSILFQKDLKKHVKAVINRYVRLN